ncbi:MAG: hypothetical protein HY423_06335 [Candidatus Lambdaproteobacteria bacterium]|nr:hypothetical protein [Candidatus Lambdaproteobacteria bacterium]
MKMHQIPYDLKGSGRWDVNSRRYLPKSGGSRSRLSILDDPTIPRYPGFVGIDGHLTDSIDSLAKLYAHLGGAPVIPEGKAGEFLRLCSELADSRLAKLAKAAEDAEAEDEKK